MRFTGCHRQAVSPCPSPGAVAGMAALSVVCRRHTAIPPARRIQETPPVGGVRGLDGRQVARPSFV